MPWFWGSKEKTGEDEDDEEVTDSEGEEEYTDDDDDEEDEDHSLLEDEEQEVLHANASNSDDQTHPAKSSHSRPTTHTNNRNMNTEEEDTEDIVAALLQLGNSSGHDKASATANMENGGTTKMPSLHSFTQQPEDSETNRSSRDYDDEDVESDGDSLKAIAAGEAMDPAVIQQVMAGEIPGKISIAADPAAGNSGAAGSGSGTGNRERIMSTLTIGDDMEDEEETTTTATGDRDNEDILTPRSLQPAESESPDSRSEKQYYKEHQSDVGSDDEEEEEEQLTSLVEKQSLLTLAAEHDRVDILNAILQPSNPASVASSSHDGNGSNSKEGQQQQQQLSPEDREFLLHSGVPPLHIAVSYGSTNACSSLLRMGADPSIRPNIKALLKEQRQQQQEQMSAGGKPPPPPPVEISNMKRFDNVSAWELAFGKGTGAVNEQGKAPSSGSKWSLFGSKSSLMDDEDSEADETRSDPRPARVNVDAVDIPPAKRLGIRHAFTAEALRAIGSDEATRLQQLLAAGMPATIEIGGKPLHDWAVDLSATACESVLRVPSPGEAAIPGHATVSKDGEASNQHEDEKKDSEVVHKSAVLDRTMPGELESVSHLANRLDELESLAKALSTCLDNLAEEVSVCHGLLLQGGGASALASHVRSLKAAKEQKYDELQRLQDAWENSEDELAYWAKQLGPEGYRIAADPSYFRQSSFRNQERRSRREALPTTFASAEEESACRQQLQKAIAACETKIRKLRVSIADLSEENTRDLEVVERRGLSGGITLVRGLREEIREVDFELNEAKAAEAACRAKIAAIQAQLQQETQKEGINGQEEGLAHVSDGSTNQQTAGESAAAPPSAQSSAGQETLEKPNNNSSNNGLSTTSSLSKAPSTTASSASNGQSSSADNSQKTPPTSAAATPAPLKDSERLLTGQSTALAIRDNATSRGFFPLTLWQILLRIIGIHDNNNNNYHDPYLRRSMSRASSGGNSSISGSGSSQQVPVMIV